MKKILFLPLALALSMATSQASQAPLPTPNKLEQVALAQLESLTPQDLALLGNYIKQMPEEQLIAQLSSGDFFYELGEFLKACIPIYLLIFTAIALNRCLNRGLKTKILRNK